MGLLIDRKTLAAAADCASRDKGAYALNAVYVDSDGSIVAADRSHLIAISPGADKPDDFPAQVQADIPATGLLLPVDFAQSLSKAIPKNSGAVPIKPILGNACLTATEGGTATFTTTDLQTQSQHQAVLVEGKFPVWKAVMADGYGKAKARITLDARRLAHLAKVAASLSAGESSQVELYIGEEGDPILMRVDMGEGRIAAAMCMPIDPDDAGKPMLLTDWERGIGAKKLMKREASPKPQPIEAAA